jgi:hypothetical protein
VITMRFVLSLFVSASLAVGCASAAAPNPTSRPSALPTAVASPSVRSTEATSPTPTDSITTLGRGDRDLDAGTYRLGEMAIGVPDLPAILITVPPGWHASGPFVRQQEPGEATGFVAVSFWHVDQIYGHPCKWNGALFQPGPTVEDLAQALVNRPLRNATKPIDVTLGGYAGKYLEWTVPAHIDVSACDADSSDGKHYFESWTGTGVGSDRYQQGPGQIDRLWILDVNGIRLLIDATSMPPTTNEQRAALLEVVKSIRFER